MNEPREFRAGDTVAWSVDLDKFRPADGYTLRYALRGPSSIDITSVPDGDKHAISLAATTTAGYAPGEYAWIAYVTNDSGFRQTLGSALLTILPNPTAITTPVDTRTHARKMLDAIEARLEGRATADQEEYTIGNRSLKRIPIEQLVAIRDKYRAEVQREADAEALGRGEKPQSKKLKVRFVR